MITEKEFREKINVDGYCVVENLIDLELVKNLKNDLEIAIDSEAKFHGSTNYEDYGVVQLCPLYGMSFIHLLENNQFVKPYNWIIGEGCIIYVYISSSLPPKSINRATRIHIDRPKFFSGQVEALAGLVVLTDFTISNGATRILGGSHKLSEAPSEEDFNEQCIDLEVKAGSVIYFNMRTWHSAGINTSEYWRHSIAIGMVPPYYKQKYDIPKALDGIGIDLSEASKQAKQKLGYYAIPPSTLEEYYIPSKRTYIQSSEWVNNE